MTVYSVSHIGLRTKYVNDVTVKFDLLGSFDMSRHRRTKRQMQSVMWPSDRGPHRRVKTTGKTNDRAPHTEPIDRAKYAAQI